MGRSFFPMLSLMFISGFGMAAFPPVNDGTLSPGEDAAKEIVEQFLAENHVEDVRFRNVLLDGLGQAHLRFDQTHAGIPVLAGQIIVHVDVNGGRALGITDVRKLVGAVSTTASVNAKAAERRVRTEIGVCGRLVATTERLISVANGTTHLIWRVNLLGLDRRYFPWTGLVSWTLTPAICFSPTTTCTPSARTHHRSRWRGKPLSARHTPCITARWDCRPKLTST